MVMGTVEQDTAKILVNELNLPVTDLELRVELKGHQKNGLSQAQFMPGMHAWSSTKLVLVLQHCYNTVNFETILLKVPRGWFVT